MSIRKFVATLAVTTALVMPATSFAQVANFTSGTRNFGTGLPTSITGGSDPNSTSTSGQSYPVGTAAANIQIPPNAPVVIPPNTACPTNVSTAMTAVANIAAVNHVTNYHNKVKQPASYWSCISKMITAAEQLTDAFAALSNSGGTPPGIGSLLTTFAQNIFTNTIMNIINKECQACMSALSGLTAGISLSMPGICGSTITVNASAGAGVSNTGTITGTGSIGGTGGSTTGTTTYNPGTGTGTYSTGGNGGSTTGNY